MLLAPHEMIRHVIRDYGRLCFGPTQSCSVSLEYSLDANIDQYKSMVKYPDNSMYKMAADFLMMRLSETFLCRKLE